MLDESIKSTENLVHFVGSSFETYADTDLFDIELALAFHESEGPDERSESCHATRNAVTTSCSNR